MTGPSPLRQPDQPPRDARAGGTFENAPDPWGVRRAENLLTSLEGVLSAFGISMALEVSPPEVATAEPMPEQPPPWRRPPVLAGVVALVVVLGIALMAGLR